MRDPVTETSPEAVLDNLMKSGYPWHALAQRLKILDQELKIVSDEYAHIDDSITKLTREMDVLTVQHKQSTTTLSEAIRKVLLEEANSLQNRWLISLALMLFLVLGLGVTVAGNDRAFNFLKQSGGWIGLLMILVGVFVMALVTTRRRRAGVVYETR